MFVNLWEKAKQSSFRTTVPLVEISGMRPLGAKADPRAASRHLQSRKYPTQKKRQAFACRFFGGDKRDRTADLLNAILGYAIIQPGSCRICIIMRNYRTFWLTYFMYFSIFLFQLRT
jgi:hypothetical protein